MAIERIGSLVQNGGAGAGSTANTGSFSASVPSDATLAIVGVSGYVGSGGGYFTDGGMTLGGTSMSEVTGGDADTAFFMGTLFYLVSPATGTQTIAWDWEGTGTAEHAVVLVYGFYKGIDTADPVRDTYGTQNATGTYATDTMTAVSGDWVIAWGHQFNWESTYSWTNATEVAEYNQNSTGSTSASWAEGQPSGDVIVTAECTPATDGGITAIVFKASGAAATNWGPLIGLRNNRLVVA